MSTVIILSTYLIGNAEQWDLCRMLERAGISEFEFITLENRGGDVKDLLDEICEHKESPIVITLDDVSAEFAQSHIKPHARVLKWYHPVDSYLPPALVGQQLLLALSEDENT